MKKVKVLISIFMVLILFSAVTVPCFAADSPYQVLLKKGFSAEFLDSLTDEMILRIYNQVGDNEVGEIQTETSYLTENADGIQPYSAISEDTMKLVIDIVPVYKEGTNNLIRAVVIAYWEWAENKPRIRKTDAVAINWDAAKFNLLPDSFFSQDMFRNKEDSDWTIGEEYTRTAESVQGGIGYYTKLYPSSPAISDYLFDYIAGATTFVLIPSEPMFLGGNYTTSININYVHDGNAWPGGLELGAKGMSVSIEPKNLSYSAAMTAVLGYSK